VETRKDVVETIFSKKSDDFLDLSSSIDQLMTKSSQKRNTILYFFLLLFKFSDHVTDLTICREYITEHLNKLNVNYEHFLLETFLQHYDTEFPPVVAILGGIIAQELFKLISHRELPIQSFFVYNGMDQSNSIEHP
jgi:hypothetical protein